MLTKKELQIGGRTFSLETGALAKQADGACIVRFGDTVVLATACYKSGTVLGDFMPPYDATAVARLRAQETQST